MGGRREIATLFALARTAPQELANRYVLLARKISLKKRISLRAYNRAHCRKCSTYFTSRTCRVRTTRVSVNYTCLSCGHRTRIPKPHATRRSS